MAKQQELNSLNRFRKRSNRLVLEEHSHCEVPAGCGGVVLRWREPDLLSYPVSIHFYSPFTATVQIDGANADSSHCVLATGRHVLTLSFEQAAPVVGLFLFAAIQGEYHPRTLLPPGVQEKAVRLLSADDGTWQFRLDTPPEGWMSPSFDSEDWRALTAAHVLPEPPPNELGSWSYRTCMERGAIALRLPGRAARGPTPVYVRKTFDILPPFGQETNP